MDVIVSKNIEEVKIYRQSSNVRRRKKCLQFLHTLEPLGIELIKEEELEITILAKDIIGVATLYIHDVEDVKFLSFIQVGVKTTIESKLKGELFLSVQTVQYVLGFYKPFTIELTLEMDQSIYKITPIYDIRKDKISTKVIDDEDLFKEAVLKDDNKEHGMLMISENSRLYMPLSKYVPKDFQALKTLELYEKTIETYNKLAGFNKFDERKIFKPREGFILVSARKNAGIGSVMLDTLLENSALYFKDYWMIFFNFAHMFEAYWSVIDIWTSMYSKYMSNRTYGFYWLWEKDRIKYEKDFIKYLYENYFDKHVKEEKSLDIKEGLYMFIAFEEVLGCDFLTKLEVYAREKHFPRRLQGVEYILFAMAKIFGINGIPYAEIYGFYMKDFNIIEDIIDSSTRTLLYVPKNYCFEKYNRVSIPVTVKRVYFSTQIIEGISNKDASIKIQIKNNMYYTKADNDGKFKLITPVKLDLSEEIIITSTEIGKLESPPKIISLIDDSNK